MLAAHNFLAQTLYARHCNFQPWRSWMLANISPLLEQYICPLVLLGKCMCIIKCTPKYLYAKVGRCYTDKGPTYRWGSNMQHKTNVIFFRCLDREVGQKTNKRSTNKQSRPISRITQPMGDENFRRPSVPGPRQEESRPKSRITPPYGRRKFSSPQGDWATAAVSRPPSAFGRGKFSSP